MKKIGLVVLDSATDLTTMYSLLKLNGFDVEQLTEDSEPKNSTIDGVVVISESDKQFQKLCEWTFNALEKYKTFVWLCIPPCSSREREIYFQLGANGLVDYQSKEIELLLLLKNFYARENHPLYLEGKSKGRLLLNSTNGSATLDEEEISLTRLEYGVLELLLKRAGETVTYNEIFEILWPNRQKGESNFRITNIVFRLREKMGLNIVKNVRSKGYRLDI